MLLSWVDRRVSDQNLLVRFVQDFVDVFDRLGIRYVIVSGFVAIAHGRSRGTEDVDVIVERMQPEKFEQLHQALVQAGFECLQGEDLKELFEGYLLEKTGIRYVKKGSFVPELELKLARDGIDDQQLMERKRLPLTNLPFYFSSIEFNIAFKEELLKSPKDLEDSRHLRVVYSGNFSEEKVREIKKLIRKHRLNR